MLPLPPLLLLACSQDPQLFGDSAATQESDSGTPPSAQASGPWQIFADDHLLADSSGISRSYHPFEKYEGNPVVSGDQRWEGGRVYVYGSAMTGEEGSGYRLWYHALPLDDSNKYALLYASSEDGISWTKPALGIAEYEGSTANNIFLRRTGYDHIPTVMHTPDSGDPACTYRIINYDAGDDPGFYGACSEDGLHFEDVAGNPLISGVGDVGNFLWDAESGLYKGWIKVSATVDDMSRRAIGYAETADFESWPEPSLVLAPDSHDDRWAPEGTEQRSHFYGMGVYDQGSTYLGLVWVFRATDETGYNDGTIFVELVASRDGIDWTREEGDRPAILPLGEAGSWDDGMLFTAQAPIVEEETMKLYYGGCDGTHGGTPTDWTCGVGLATARRDGLVSLDAGQAEGSITTPPLHDMSGALQLNYAASGGSIRVALLDAAGQPVEGYGLDDCQAMSGDSVAQTVTWGAPSSLPEGGPYALRFSLQGASLYAFRAGELSAD